MKQIIKSGGIEMTDKTSVNSGTSLRYGMFIPLALFLASVFTCCFSYSNAKQSIADDLNNAIYALANENSQLWTRADTIAAIRHMHETTHKPLMFQAADVNFKTPSLKNEAYFTLALVDSKKSTYRTAGNKIASDSIMLIPERSADGIAIQVQGFADCSMATVFSASDQKLPGILFALSFLSMGVMFLCKREETEMAETEIVVASAPPSLDDIKLTPMQRQLTRMLLDAPHMRVDKMTLCESLWGNKSNAEESLYTLVKRTKSVVAQSNMEIICNRGDSYELRIIN